MKKKRQPASGNSQKHKAPSAWLRKAPAGSKTAKARTARRNIRRKP